MKGYKKIRITIVAICLMLLVGCGNTTSSESNTIVNNEQNQLTEDNAKETTEIPVGTEVASQAGQESEEDSMTITLNETEYEVSLDQNETVKDIVSNMPLNLDMVRYADHEFYSELPFTPVFDKDRTSEIKAGHVYYWDGWNAFVINYIDSDISPYKVVHIGEVNDKSVCDILATGADNIQIEVNE